MTCNPGVLPKHIKIIFISLIKRRFTTSAQFQFPSYVQFYKFSLGCCFHSPNSHQNHLSHFQSHVGTICRLLVTGVPVGHSRRLVYSTPNREGPYAPLRNTHNTSTQPTQNKSNRVATRPQINDSRSYLSKPFIKVNPCSLIN